MRLNLPNIVITATVPCLTVTKELKSMINPKKTITRKGKAAFIVCYLWINKCSVILPEFSSWNLVNLAARPVKAGK